MHFLLTLAVVATLVIAEHAPPGPIAGVATRLVLAAVGMLIVPLVAAFLSVGTARQMRRHPECQPAVLRQFKRLRSLHGLVWLSTALAIESGADWPQIVRFNWGLGGTFLLDQFLILAPVLVPLVLSWAAFYEVDREASAGPFGDAAPGTVPLGQGNAVPAGLGLPAMAQGSSRTEFHSVPDGLPIRPARGNGLPIRPAAMAIHAGGVSRGTYVAVHSRHYLGILLVPVFAMLAIQDAMRLWLPGFQEGGRGVAVCGASILLLVVCFPVLLRYTWQTRPLCDGPLRDRLQRAARRAGLRVREILVWNTGGLVINAAVAGVVPHLRYVFLTDGLLEHLRDDEIQAVFGHEIGHIRHGHLFLRGFALLAPLSLWLLARQAMPQLGQWLEEWFLSGGPLWQAHAALLGLAGMCFYMLAVFGPFCRLLEGQADLYGCRTLAEEPTAQPVQTFVSALESLALASGTDRQAGNWQHWSIAQRVDFLNRLARQPAGQRLFQRRLRLVHGLLLAVILSPAVYHVLW